MSICPQPFSSVFASALGGEPCSVDGLGPTPRKLPVGAWTRQADASDRVVLSRCVGATLDIGCGPGRMSAHLAGRGQPVLGIDLVAEAVRQTRERGAFALVRDVFADLPWEGQWQTTLLADGNIGIGGEPGRLLRRVHALLAPGGRVVADLAPPYVGIRRRWLVLHTASGRTAPFPWAEVGADAIGGLAASCHLRVDTVQEHDGRWYAVLVKRRR